VLFVVGWLLVIVCCVVFVMLRGLCVDMVCHMTYRMM